MRERGKSSAVLEKIKRVGRRIDNAHLVHPAGKALRKKGRPGHYDLASKTGKARKKVRAEARRWNTKTEDFHVACRGWKK